MSLHPSLKIDKASVTKRTVFKRIERIKEMMKKGTWKQDSEVTGLPKTRITRVKAKKKVKEAAEGDEKAAAPAAGAAKPAAKAAAPKK